MSTDATRAAEGRASFVRRPIGDVLRDASFRADWALLRGVYGQCIEIANDRRSARFMPDTLVGYLAEALVRLAANYYGEEEEFVVHALAVLGAAEGAEHLEEELFQRLYSDERFDRFKQYGVDDAGEMTRRRPRPFETVIETARRYRDANVVQSVLSPSTSGILGGSLSYGRFFNVAGARNRNEASDLDLLVIVPGFGRLPEVLDALHGVDGMSEHGLARAKARGRRFGTLDLDDGATIFSHRLAMWDGTPDPMMTWADVPHTYGVSLHVLSRAVLDYLLVRHAPKLDSDYVGGVRSIRDYRESESPDGADVQRSFSGRYRHVPTDTRPVDGGFLRNSGVFSIEASRYFPGMFQNLVFPRYDLRWDTLGVRGALEAFRYKMIERLRYERMTRPYEMLEFSLAHTRAEVFAPRVLEKIDGGIGK